MTIALKRVSCFFLFLMSVSFCHCIFSGSHTHKAEHSSGLWEFVSDQSVTLNLSTLKPHCEKMEQEKPVRAQWPTCGRQGERSLVMEGDLCQN